MEIYKSRHAPPQARAMIEALRGLGYSTATALADIIDNSISAGAKSVDLRFVWKGSNSRIEIQDDGSGMTSTELDKAMRLGEKNPLEERSSNDLGRFGLGLKTASFSQCRRLTVSTIGTEGFQCLRWDLDVIAASKDDGWHLLEGPDPNSKEFLTSLKLVNSGTLVLWENLDRVVTEGVDEQEFLDLIDSIEFHLAMVFHRYLEGTKPRLCININGKKIIPWDPFLSGHPSKPWHSPVDRAPSCIGVEIECHVLPHKDKLSNKEYEYAQGSDGWTAQQGFYVYRNERLLVAGSWLGLGHGRSWTKDESHKLARIRLDIPNSVDADWKIDIRKSKARPPAYLRPWLIRHAEDVRARARKVFAYRGQSSRSPQGNPVIQAWQAAYFSGGMRYQIDTQHPAVRAVLDDAGILLPQIKAMLRVIEETVPVQRIWLDTVENKETPTTGFSGEETTEVMEIMKIMYRNMIEIKGMSSDMARDRLLHAEPFQNYPNLIASLPDYL